MKENNFICKSIKKNKTGKFNQKEKKKKRKENLYSGNYKNTVEKIKEVNKWKDMSCTGLENLILLRGQ